jgi:hypothetical protein
MMLQQHPLSSAFPAMSADDFQALKDSIEVIGVQNPVTLFQGMVIDGWHRYTAAQAVGMDCPTVELGDVDPRDFVLAQNKARRHITHAQIAMATAMVYFWREIGENQYSEKRVATECPPSKTNTELANIASVSVATIKQAKSVQTNAAPEVIAAVKAGEIGLPKAAKLAKLPKEEQAAAISRPIAQKQKKPVHVVDRSDELSELRHTVCDLAAENETLRDRLAVESMDALEEEKTQTVQIIHGLRAKVAELEAELSAVKVSRDTYQRENSELMKQCASQRKKLQKLGGE